MNEVSSTPSEPTVTTPETPTPTSPPPLPNSPEARNPDGSLKDAQSTTTPSESNADAKPTPEPGKPESPAKPTDAPAVPETYTFTVPEGYKLDDSVVSDVTPVLKELNLTQEQAQKLMDFHVGQMIKATDGPLNAIANLREKWQGEYKADPEIGNKLPQVKVEIDRALNTLGDPKLVGDFKAAMNLTGVGDNPAFIKAIYKLAQKIPTEGNHVAGAGPSPHGQTKTGASARPTAAQALFPNNPSSAS